MQTTAHVNNKQSNENDIHQSNGIKIDTSIKPHRRGVILVTRYAEQQVGAAMNMFSLQKWAKTVGASVVEPFIQNSEFRLPIISSQDSLNRRLQFSDYFDIDTWNKMSILNNGTPLISFETFLQYKPKKYIFVTIINNPKMVKRSTHVNEELFEEPLCQDTFDWFNTKYDFYINQLLQVQVARKVCLSFYTTRMNIEDFTNIIYGDLDPTDAMVWIQIWKGFSKNNRVKIYQEHFHRNNKSLSMLKTSKRISDDSQKYIKKYLTSDSYTAISIRTVVRAKFMPNADHILFFQNCIGKLEEVISSISNNTVFMAMDLGRFGDSIAERFINKTVINFIEQKVFQTVYNNSLTMKKWEQSFIQATNGITDSGYIAAMQRTILENSRCLIMFGGRSNFQRSLLLTYKEKHGNQSCVYEVCYEP